MTVATLVARDGSVNEPKVPKRDDGAIEIARMRQWLKERIDGSQIEPITEIVTLTPTLAKLLLERNKENRPLSETQLERLARDLNSGRWEFNGETIVIAKTGELNNGQHRCHAVISSGRSMRVIMVFGTERTSRMTIDTGVTRTVGHFLAMNGHHDVNNLAAIASNLWQYKQNGRLSHNGRDKPTKAEALMIVNHYSDIPESLLFVSRKGAGRICTRSLLGFVHYVIGHARGNPAIEAFLEKLIDGTELKKDDPILYCRNRLIEMKSTMKLGEKAELIFRAWNMFRRGDRGVRIPITGRMPELEP